MPGFIWENFDILIYSILAAIISIIVIRSYAKKLQEEKGQQLPVFLISLGLLIVLLTKKNGQIRFKPKL